MNSVQEVKIRTQLEGKTKEELIQEIILLMIRLEDYDE